MKLDEIRNTKRTHALPVGNFEVVFKKFQWRTDAEGEVKGAWIHIDGYKPLYLTFFEDRENYQLDYFLDQIGCETDVYDDNLINEYAGTVIKVSRYPNGEYINTSFNPNPRTYAKAEEFA